MELQHLGQRALHAKREFVRLDDAFEFQICVFLAQKLAIHFLDQIDLGSLTFFAEMAIPNILNTTRLEIDPRPLVRGR